MFDWDSANLPIPIYEQADRRQKLIVSPTSAHAVRGERHHAIRVVTAYVLDAGQKRDYLKRRVQGG